MGVDLRQVVAGILTITMFFMLGNMIKRDHFDSVQEKLPGTSIYDTSKVSKFSHVSFSKNGKGDGQELKQCWSNPASEDIVQSKGYITFSLTNGPEYHVSQVADAVVVARYLGATLVIPDIRGSKPGDKRNFEEIYNVEKFIQSLDGVVRVAKKLPNKISARTLAVVKVPNRVTEDDIKEHVEPAFRKNRNIRLATYFPSINMKKKEEKSSVDSVACLGMFGTLELQPEVQEVVDSMVEWLRTLSRKSSGRFVAVDLREDILEKKGCQGTKSCYSAEQIAEFLRKVRFDKDTVIYLTQARWDDSLDPLKGYSPKTYTKESIMAEDKKADFLESEMEKVIDFYVCGESDVFVLAISGLFYANESDVFVLAISGLFYANVAGKRIASGMNQILVPARISSSSATASDFISSYVSKKKHLAYSCFC